MKKNYQIPETQIVELKLLGSILQEDGEFSGTLGGDGTETNKTLILDEDEIPTGTSSSLWD